MRPTTFVALAVAAATSFALATAIFLSERPWSRADAMRAEPMLPNLRKNPDQVAALEIVGGHDRIRLANSSGKWLIETSGGYPADTQAVRKFVIAASEADLVERKTAKKELHKILGLTDPEGGGSGRLARFLEKDGKPIAEIVIGNPKHEGAQDSATGTYVRRPGEDQTWLANRPMSGTLSMRDWAQTKIIDWSTESIKSAVVEVAGEVPYTLSRDGTAKSHKLDDMPSGKKLKFVNSVDDIVEAASLIEFKNVRRAGSKALPPKSGQVTLDRDNGVKVVIEYFSNDKEAWVTINPASDANDKAAEADIAARTEGWEFEVPTAEITATLKKRADLLEDNAS